MNKVKKEQMEKAYVMRERIGSQIHRLQVRSSSKPDITLDEFEVLYHRNYKAIVEELNMLSPEQTEKYEAQMKIWKDVLKNVLTKILTVNCRYESVSRSNATLQELKEVITENEGLFKKEVMQAVNYFGSSFFNEVIYFNEKSHYSVLNSVMEPVRIKYILETSVTDWTQLDVKRGVPIPYYHTWYNRNLPDLVSKYFE